MGRKNSTDSETAPVQSLGDDDQSSCKKKKALGIIEKSEILSSKASEKQKELCKLLQLSTNKAFCVVLTVTLKSLINTDGVS